MYQLSTVGVEATQTRGFILMKAKLFSPLTAIILMLNATPAVANLDPPSTTGELYAACLPLEGKQNFNLSGAELFNAGFCLGAIEARSMELRMRCMFEPDAMPMLRSRAADQPVPAQVQAFINYARNNPQEWGDPLLGGLAKAFSKYFPCE